MCIHALIVFACAHEQWGPRMRSCILGQEFEAGNLPQDCVFKAPHGLKSIRSSHTCNDCTDIEEKPVDAALSTSSDVEDGESRSARCLELQIERATREDREQRFQEEKAHLEEIKRLRSQMVTCYGNVFTQTVNNDVWIHSDSLEFIESPSGESVDTDNLEGKDRTLRDSGVGFENFSTENVFDVGYYTSDSQPKQDDRFAEPTAASPPTEIDRRPVTPPASKIPKAPTRRSIPRTSPKSRLALPAAEFSPHKIRVLTTAPPSHKSHTSTRIPSLSSAAPSLVEQAEVFKAASQSRLALTTSKIPSLQVQTQETGLSPKLHKPGRARK